MKKKPFKLSEVRLQLKTQSEHKATEAREEEGAVVVVGMVEVVVVEAAVVDVVVVVVVTMDLVEPTDHKKAQNSRARNANAPLSLTVVLMSAFAVSQDHQPSKKPSLNEKPHEHYLIVKFCVLYLCTVFIRIL